MTKLEWNWKAIRPFFDMFTRILICLIVCDHVFYFLILCMGLLCFFYLHARYSPILSWSTYNTIIDSFKGSLEGIHMLNRSDLHCFHYDSKFSKLKVNEEEQIKMYNICFGSQFILVGTFTVIVVTKRFIEELFHVTNKLCEQIPYNYFADRTYIILVSKRILDVELFRSTMAQTAQTNIVYEVLVYVEAVLDAQGEDLFWYNFLNLISFAATPTEQAEIYIVQKKVRVQLYCISYVSKRM